MPTIQDNGPNYKGLYQYRARNTKNGPVYHYFKFYKKNRIVIFVYSTGKPTKVARWLKKDTGPFRYHQYKLTEDSLEFQLSFHDSVKTKYIGAITSTRLIFRLENTFKGQVLETFTRTYYLKNIQDLKKGEKARAKGKVHVLAVNKDMTKKKERWVKQWRKKVAKLEKKKEKKHGGK